MQKYVYRYMIYDMYMILHVNMLPDAFCTSTRFRSKEPRDTLDWRVGASSGGGGAFICATWSWKMLKLETHHIQQYSKSLEFFVCGGGRVLSFGEVFGEPPPGRDWISHLWYFVHDHDATIEEVEFPLNLQDFRSSANKKLHNIPDRWIELCSADVGWLIKQLRQTGGSMASASANKFSLGLLTLMWTWKQAGWRVGAQALSWPGKSAYNLSGFGSVPPLWATHSSQVTCWSPLSVDSWEACGFEACWRLWGQEWLTMNYWLRANDANNAHKHKSYCDISTYLYSISYHSLYLWRT